MESALFSRGLRKSGLVPFFQSPALYSNLRGTMPSMADVLVNIALILLLLLVVLALCQGLFAALRRSGEARSQRDRMNQPPPPPQVGGVKAASVDPWVESGRRLKLDQEPPTDPGPDEGRPRGGRFE